MIKVTKRCVRCHTRQEKLHCVSFLAGIIIFTAFLFLLTLGLIMSFSYAVNSKIYNMSSGCPFVEANCTDRIPFYAHGEASVMLGWTTLLVLIELVVSFVLMLFWLLIKHRFDPIYNKYSLVEELPPVPSSEIYDQ